MDLLCVNLNMNRRLTESQIETGTFEVLKKIRPEWFKMGKHIQSKIFADGITNKLIVYYIDHLDSEAINIKIFGRGTDMFANREVEIETMKFLAKGKSGPEIYATFENGIAYAFIPGLTINVKNCQDPEIYPLVAKEMAKWHSMSMDTLNLNDFQTIWEKLWKIYDIDKEHLEDNEHEWLRLRLQDVGFTMKWAERKIKKLEALVKAEKMPVTFCHNDLLLGNVIYDKLPHKVTFIDIEHAGPCYAPFDIANHFCEYAGVHHVDYKRYPSRELITDWLRIYMKNLTGPNFQNISIEQWTEWVTLCVPLAHLMWILFGVHHAIYSKIDFDYIEYLRLRLEELERNEH